MARAELSSDGMPPPPDLPQGEFWCTRLPDGGLRIDYADPRILISHEVLHQVAAKDSPWASVNWGSRIRMDSSQRTVYTDAVLKIHGTNRTVIYRITDYVPRVHAYIGEWPD